MMKLSDTQLEILNAAAQRDRLIALPFPDALKVRGGAAQKVVASMIAKGLGPRRRRRRPDARRHGRRPRRHRYRARG